MCAPAPLSGRRCYAPPMTAHPEDPHPARDLSPERRGDYLFAVGAMVHADGRVDDVEIDVLRRLARVLDLSEDATEAVVRGIREHDRARVESILDGFAG